MISLPDALGGKLAEFVGGPMDGDRCELPRWALMHDGSIAVPAQKPETLLNRELNLADLQVALYRPDTKGLPSSEGGINVRLTPDRKALRYVYQPPDEMGPLDAP